MKNEGKFLTMVLAMLVLVIAGHSIVHFSGIGGSISGRVSDATETDGQSSNVFAITPSLIFLILEWSLLITLVMYGYSRFRVDLKKEYEDLHSVKHKEYDGNYTDIDKLYELLKERKSLHVSTIAKVFDVDNELVESWGKTLETAHFATITYPRIGGPKINIVEKKEVTHATEETQEH